MQISMFWHCQEIVHLIYELSVSRMIGKNTRIWLNEGNEFHLIESTANLVNHFIKNMTITNNFIR